MAKKSITYSQKYPLGIEIKTITGKTLKDGYIFSNTKGIITSFNDKTNIYEVDVTLVNGEKMTVKYQEDEIILANLSVKEMNDEVEKAKLNNRDLLKKNLLLTIIGCTVAIITIIVCLVITLNNLKYFTQLITLSIGLILVLSSSLIMLILTNKNSRKIKLNSRKIEQIVLSEIKDEEIKEDTDESIKQIKELTDLHEKGALTDKEYSDAKKKIIKKL